LSFNINSNETSLGHVIKPSYIPPPPSPNRKTTTTLFDWGYAEHLKKEKIQKSLTIKPLELITGAQLGSYNL